MTNLIKLSSLKVDLRAEREGEWIEPKDWPNVGPVPGIAFLVRSTQYPAYITARAHEQQRLAKRFDGGDIPQDELAKADGRLAVEHLLLGWRGFDVEYSEEAAAELLTSEEGRIIRNMIFWCASRVGARDVEFMETEGKNSETSSAIG